MDASEVWGSAALGALKRLTAPQSGNPFEIVSKMAAPIDHTQSTVNGTASESDRIEKHPQLTHTSTNISLSPELFEKLYLAPKVPHAADNVGRYANATPLGFLG